MNEQNNVVAPIPNQEPQRRGRRVKKEEPKEGKALKSWALFFFVISCIMTGIVAASIALPFFIVLFGILSALCWILFIVVGTVFTLGMMWLVDGMQEFNEGWMAFNNKLFDSSNAIANVAASAIPIFSIVGGSIVAITWLFMVIGLVTDNNRKKFYTAMIIVLSVLSFIYIAIAIITILIHTNTPEPIGSSNSFNF